MKKRNVMVVSSILLIFIIIGAIFMFKNRKTFTLDLPIESEIINITLIINNDSRTIEKEDNIKNILHNLNGVKRVTEKDSIQDTPTVREYIKIDFQLENKVSTLFAYSNNKKYFIEQPYNGIYEISKEEYDSIIEFYNGLKTKVQTIEESNLKKAINKLNPLDQHGKSFKVSELTNDELLRYGFFQFNPKNSGFEDITFQILNRTYINGSFADVNATPKDILCSCGKVIAKYDSSNDTYTWDKTYHYLEHKADTFNEIKDIYKIEDNYVVEVYKIFPDLLKNSSTSKYNFYSTYNDSVEQNNVVFTVTDENEFEKVVKELEDSKKVLYKLTFKRDGLFHLVSYEILK